MMIHTTWLHYSHRDGGLVRGPLSRAPRLIVNLKFKCAGRRESDGPTSHGPEQQVPGYPGKFESFKEAGPGPDSAQARRLAFSRAGGLGRDVAEDFRLRVGGHG
eukprot:2524492-Rhodomonas_salina.1